MYLPFQQFSLLWYCCLDNETRIAQYILIRSVLKNLFSLGFIQLISLLIPILLTPLLITRIGISYFGTIATAQGFVLLFNIITDFGFNITAVRSVAQANNNENELMQIVNSVSILKIILLVLSFILFLFVIYFVPQFNQYFKLYLYSFLMVIGQAFLPIWYYQGREIITKTLVPILVGKVISVFAILMIIKVENDALYVNLLLGLGTIISAVYLNIPIIKKYQLRKSFFEWEKMKVEVNQNLPFFISNASVFAYSNSATLVLSFFVSPYTVGIFNVAEKIIQLGKTMLVMIHQVTYTKLCALITDGHEIAISFLRKIYSIIWSGVLVFCLLLFFFSYEAVSFFITDEQQHLAASQILKSLAFLLLVIAFNMPFYQYLLALKKDWVAVRIIIICSVISIVLNFLLVPMMQINGLVMTMYFIEALVTIFLIVQVLNLKQRQYVS